MFRRILGSRTQRAGTVPGTITYTGAHRKEPVRLNYMNYNAQQLLEGTADSLEECKQALRYSGVTWINFDGIHDTSMVRAAGELFSLHPLTLEDIVDTDQRPKVEDYGHYYYIVAKMLWYDEQSETVQKEQISIVLLEGYVLTFQEQRGDSLGNVRSRIRSGKGLIRSTGADYLAYSILDAIVDAYFRVLEEIGEDVESLEEAIVQEPEEGTLQEIHALKRELIVLRRSVWPLRELVMRIQKQETALITKETYVYLQDVTSNALQIMDIIESFRDIVSGMLDTYLSSLSNKTNEVMKVLTVFATIFIPLTFIAGVYGMNFSYMPELQIWWFYPVLWGVFIAIIALMLFYFKRRHWI
nr:magnesium/cobalt transporter CorA [Synergistales bacterium]